MNIKLRIRKKVFEIPIMNCKKKKNYLKKVVKKYYKNGKENISLLAMREKDNEFY
jgi:hypothetical protein